MGLKPSAMECEARLRGLERNNYSKTISLHPLSFQASGRPESPVSHKGRRGQGDDGQKRTGIQKITHPVLRWNEPTRWKAVS